MTIRLIHKITNSDDGTNSVDISEQSMRHFLNFMEIMDVEFNSNVWHTRFGVESQYEAFEKNRLKISDTIDKCDNQVLRWDIYQTWCTIYLFFKKIYFASGVIIIQTI
jgi:hypothetical protein